MTLWPCGFRKIIRDQRGVTAIEFSLISPVLFLMVMGTVEMGLALFAQSVLEGGTFTASRLGKTGYVAEEETQEETIRNILSQKIGSLLNMDDVEISYTIYSQFDQIGQPEPFIDNNDNGVRDVGENYTDSNGNGVYDDDVGAIGLGNPGEVVVYKVSYPWKIYTPIVSNVLGKNGVINLEARTVIQNEPY